MNKAGVQYLKHDCISPLDTDRSHPRVGAVESDAGAHRPEKEPRTRSWSRVGRPEYEGERGGGS